MFPKQSSKQLMMVIMALMLSTLACLSGGSSGDDESVDLQATSAALQATQDAIAQNSQTDSQESPQGGAEDGESQPAQSSSGNSIDYESLQSGDVVYSTDFDGTGDDWEEGWFHFTVPAGEETYDAYVDNGNMYVGLGVTRTTVYLMYEPISMPRGNADMLVKAATDNVGNVRNNNISVVCRATDEGWYEFSISSSGLWWIYKYDAVTGEYLSLIQGGVPNYNKNITDHVIAASCIGDELTFYYDGTALKNGQVNDNTFREGGFGVSVYADNLPDVEVEFDWFEVEVP